MPFVLIAAMIASPVVADPIPTIRAIDGTVVRTERQVTVINFWATWCAPCRAELPLLDAFYRRHRAQGLELVAVSLDSNATDRKLRETTKGFAFPIARIADTRIARRDIPRALPVTRIYDRTGKLVYASKGDGRSTIDMATLERAVSPLLAKR
jgi:thiol-disulfide isomerase/thioredoxin